MPYPVYRYGKLVAALTLALLLAGCASMASQKLSQGLASAMLNQDDPEIVRAGAPAYLLLIDSLISDSPQDSQLLLAGAQLYGAYGSGLIKDPERAKKLTRRAREFANRALCLKYTPLCGAHEEPFEQFEAKFKRLGNPDIGVIYGYATAWASWIQKNSDDWSAVADLPKVSLLLEHIVSQDPGFQTGRAQLYLAVMKSQLPASLGGKPEQGRKHFEQAIHYSGGLDLFAKVEFARKYARLVFNQELHDKLLNEVLQADPYQENLTLTNILAKQEAAILLSDDYF